MAVRKTFSRLTELPIAIVLVICALIWAERSAWNQISTLRSDVSPARVERLSRPVEIQSAILQLHREWQDARTRMDFVEVTNQVTHIRELITAHAAAPIDPQEQAPAQELRERFAAYVDEISSASSDQQTTAVEAAFASLLDASEKLVASSENAADQFVEEVNTALLRLQRFIFVSLFALLVSGAAIIGIAYRRTITPLRTSVMESRSIIERQEKLASLGVFATGIAHEIRNPLTAIKVRLFSLKANRMPSDSEREDLEVIENEIGRLERIVRDFLQFARPAEPDLRPVEVAELLRDTVGLLKADLAAKQVRLEAQAEASPVMMMDADKMKQVLINFVRNAAEGIDHEGSVILRSRFVPLQAAGKDRPAVAIDIIDTGKGMTPEVQKRLFDPFFTTKEHGTGLGLPIAARIVEKHGGIIQYETQVNRGTTFTIILPLQTKHEVEA